jgi:hypothetical protein
MAVAQLKETFASQLQAFYTGTQLKMIGKGENS